MAIRKPTERTNKFLEITDPKKAVGLWSYYAVRETAITPVGNTFKALGRFLPEDIARWKRRDEMGAAMEAGKGQGVKLPNGKKKFHSPAQIIGKYQEKCKQDEKRLSLVEWRTKYRWLFLWQKYGCRLVTPLVEANEPDTHMFFNAPSAGLNCHEGNLHSGRVFFLRTKVKSEVEVEQWRFNYFVCVVLKPGGTKWWSQIDKTNVTWTDNVYDRLIIDPRGGLSWSPILAEVINERVQEKDICLFMLEDDALFRAITDNELNPYEKYAHLCYGFDFFCKDAESDHRSFYMRWSVFFNPKKGKFDSVTKQKPRLIEVMGERKKGWISRRIEVKDWNADRLRDTQKEAFSDVATTLPSVATPQSQNALSASIEGTGGTNQQLTTDNQQPAKYANGRRRRIVSKSAKEVALLRLEDAKLGLGETALDKYVQDVAQWVAANNGCAVIPANAPRELRLALSHALFFVTFPDRKPNEIGGILRGYQLPGRLVEHAVGEVRANISASTKERMAKISEEATSRRRKMVVDCLFTRACAAVASRNRNALPEQDVVRRMIEINARATIEKAAWQRGFMEGNPLNQFMPGPMAGINKLPNLSLALCFEHKLGLKGETAGDELLVQTSPIRPLKEAQGSIRHSISGVYPCKSLWTPKPGTENERIIYATDTLRIIRDEGRFYLMAMPKYTIYRVERDLAYEPDVRGKKRKDGVPVRAVNVVSGTGARSRSDVSVTEELFEYNKVMQMARDGRLMLFSIDFGRDKWLADIVYSEKNSKPCKIVPSLPVLSETGVAKKDAFSEDQISGSEYRTRIKANTETCDAHITFTFNPTVDRDRRKVEGRSWKSYLDAFPAEAQRTVVRWPSAEGLGIGDQGLGMALQEVIETDGVLLTDKEHLEEALRAATYVIPAPSTKHKALSTSPYDGLNLKDRIFKDTDGRAEWRASQAKVEGEGEEDRKKKAELNAKYEAQRREQKGKPLCEVLSPDIAKEAEIEFTRQIEADTLVDAKTPKTFKLDEPIKVTDDFKEAVAREFRRIAYTGTMGWRQKLNRPAHEVAVGIWLARL